MEETCVTPGGVPINEILSVYKRASPWSICCNKNCIWHYAKKNEDGTIPEAMGRLLGARFGIHAKDLARYVYDDAKRTKDVNRDICGLGTVKLHSFGRIWVNFFEDTYLAISPTECKKCRSHLCIGCHHNLQIFSCDICGSNEIYDHNEAKKIPVDKRVQKMIKWEEDTKIVIQKDIEQEINELPLNKSSLRWSISNGAQPEYIELVKKVGGYYHTERKYNVTEVYGHNLGPLKALDIDMSTHLPGGVWTKSIMTTFLPDPNPSQSSNVEHVY